jgi:predicted DNA-binding transcriptional regulator AlpA
MEVDALLTVKEVRLLTKLGESTIWRYVAEEKIPAPVKIGKAVRWKTSVIAEWIANGCPRCPSVDAVASAS